MKVELVNIRQLPWVNRGLVYQITDLLTGLKYNIVGEHNSQRHADYVCASRADTDIKRRTAAGGHFNEWTARPVILTIGDRHFAAATHNAAHAPNMPRLRVPDYIGHSGHFCVWVLEATTNGSESYRRDMLGAVHRAYEMAQNLNLKQNMEVEKVMTQEQFNEMLDAYRRSLGQQQTIPEWGTAPWAWAADNGITDGTRPHDKITRLEAVTLLHRFDGMLESGQAVQGDQAAQGDQIAQEPSVTYAENYTPPPPPVPQATHQVTLTNSEMNALRSLGRFLK